MLKSRERKKIHGFYKQTVFRNFVNLRVSLAHVCIKKRPPNDDLFQTLLKQNLFLFSSALRQIFAFRVQILS
jgi:hypothetical protein